MPAPIERIKPKFEGLYEEFRKKQEVGLITIRTNERASKRYESRTSFKRMALAGLVALVPFFGVWAISQIGKWGSDHVTARDKQLQGMQLAANATIFAKVTPVSLVGGPGVQGTPTLSSVTVSGSPAPIASATVVEAFPLGVGYTNQQIWEAFGGKGPAPTPLVIKPVKVRTPVAP